MERKRLSTGAIIGIVGLVVFCVLALPVVGCLACSVCTASLAEEGHRMQMEEEALRQQGVTLDDTKGEQP